MHFIILKALLQLLQFTQVKVVVLWLSDETYLREPDQERENEKVANHC